MLTRLEIFIKRKLRQVFSSYYEKGDRARLTSTNFVLISRNFIEISKYADAYNNHPIGLLGDVEIHFQHYESIEEAREKWNRRKERMLKVPKDNYFFTICDRREVTPANIKEFHTLDFKNKLSFSFYKIPGLTNHQHLKFIKDPNKKKGTPPNGKKRFKLSFLYFDLVHWLNKGIVTRTRYKD